jgi:hypothetical protein
MRCTRVSVRGSPDGESIFANLSYTYPLCASTLDGFECYSLFNNDDRCNVRKEAISRDAENAHPEKVTTHQNEVISVNRWVPTTCSRVHKIWNQDSGRFDSTFGQHSVMVCPRISKSSNLENGASVFGNEFG